MPRLPPAWIRPGQIISRRTSEPFTTSQPASRKTGSIRFARVSASVSSYRLMGVIVSRQFAAEGPLEEGLAELIEVDQCPLVGVFEFQRILLKLHAQLSNSQLVIRRWNKMTELPLHRDRNLIARRLLHNLFILLPKSCTSHLIHKELRFQPLFVTTIICKECTQNDFWFVGRQQRDRSNCRIVRKYYIAVLCDALPKHVCALRSQKLTPTHIDYVSINAICRNVRNALRNKLVFARVIAAMVTVEMTQDPSILQKPGKRN